MSNAPPPEDTAPQFPLGPEQLLHLLQDSSNNIRHAKTQQWQAGYFTVLALGGLAAAARALPDTFKALTSSWSYIVAAILIGFLAAAAGGFMVWNSQRWMRDLRKSMTSAETGFSQRYRDIAGLGRKNNDYHSVFYKSAQAWIITVVIVVWGLIALAIIILPLVAASTTAQAQTSEEYAVLGKRAWAAFECSTLVEEKERAEERQRLFDVGYEQGKAFIEALQRGRVAPEDVSRHVPIEVLDKLKSWETPRVPTVDVRPPEGYRFVDYVRVNPRLPTIDFRLGAIWESAARNVLDRIQKSDDPKLFAMSEYDRRNCSLLLTVKPRPSDRKR